MNYTEKQYDGFRLFNEQRAPITAGSSEDCGAMTKGGIGDVIEQ